MSVECKGKNCCVVGCSGYFHKINQKTPIGEFVKHQNSTDYCKELRDYAGKAYGIGPPPYRLYSGKGSKANRAAVLQSLDIVAQIVHNDLVIAKKQKNFITDENAKRIKQVARSLKQAGLTGYHLEKEADELAWFVGGNPLKIKTLQHQLNALGIHSRHGFLKEDGVYGKETLDAWTSFMSKLEHGIVPTLTWINPLQSKLTGITTAMRNTSRGAEFSRIVSTTSDIPLFRADVHRYGTINNYYHINSQMLPNASKLQRRISAKLDHVQLSENAYNALKNFNNIAKPVRVAGKIFLVAGIALDTLELGITIDADLKDADKKLGKTTLTTGASIGGRWAGGALGAKLGAMGGASLGTAIFPGIGTVVGGAVGSLVLGIIGTFSGDSLAKWVIDITDL